MATLVDSCVLLDLFTNDPQWVSWSSSALANQADQGSLIINPFIYAEISIRFARIEVLEAVLTSATIECHPLPKEAAFLAGKCYLRYRRQGGAKTAPLPDFFIGAHAAVAGLPLLTRDPRRFAKYFPSVRLISP
ncbi:MAG: hypothetical protein BWX88_04470 [Planctomycetes bacterium ADurb.Bin126]|nr:MAG: hypothetical protein BWX88_04470 [Planctomycetes bacterium ADurb.Bin126]HOD82532.1 type II toxin-antitoxin system VapC family toxin [Phycisphaerae bacterium]HQL74940.1 type II toxin-antitoxin system VapC family toxin [Phycisphaerae bacterium]